MLREAKGKVAVVSSSYVEIVRNFFNASRSCSRGWEISGVWFPESSPSFSNIDIPVPRFPLRRSSNAFGVDERSAELFESISTVRPDLVVLVRYLFLVHPPLEYRGRIINVHGSLLPAYGGKGQYGVRLQEAILQAGERKTGCSVHLVSEQYDVGDILAQVAIPIDMKDTPVSLHRRVADLEVKTLIGVIDEQVLKFR